MLLGYVAGPARCWEDIEADAKASLIDIGYQTYVTADMACMERGVSYVPHLIGTHPENITSPTRQGAMQKCLKLCGETPECGRFTITFPEGLCSMAAERAAPFHTVGSVSGPRLCLDKAKATYWKLYDGPGEGKLEAEDYYYYY